MRKIIHIDMDAFFASVELRDQPQLQGLPVVVGLNHPRSVIAAASYPARKFGLHSAMPMAQARKLCPQLICIEPNFQKYREVSGQIHQIFQQYTPLIEPLSLDEAYLDVTENLKQLASATDVAIQIRADIFQATGLTASAGVAPNKFLAKVASDWNKPNGLCVIKPSQVQAFIQQLPLNKIPGVGKVTQEKLQAMQLHTLGDLQEVDEQLLRQHFGKYGVRLYQYAHGVDERPLQLERERRQISKETTFDQDLTLNQCMAHWPGLLNKVWSSLQQKQLCARGISIKLKLKNFQILQHSKSFKHSFHSMQAIEQLLPALLAEMHIPAQAQFRLIGIGLYLLSEPTQDAQLSLPI